MSRNVHSLVAFAGLAVSATAHAETWANNAAGGTQTWSTGANWVGGVPPISDINTSLVFNYNFSSTAQTSQNNIGAGTFSLNSIVMNNESVGGLTLSALAAANTLTFTTNGAAVGPSLTNSSSAAATISAGLSLANDLSIGGAGNGNLTLSGIIAGSGGMSLGTSGLGVVSLTGTNTYTGVTTINSGNVSVGNANSFGNSANNVVINGGSLRFSSAVTLGQTFTLNSDLNLTGAVNGTIAGAMSGAGGIRLRGLGTTAATNTFTFQGNNTFTGNFDAAPGGIVTGVTTTLSGANGAFSNVGAIRLAGNQAILLDNTASNNANRLNDAAAITMNRGTLQLSGNSAGSTETVGAITYRGGTTLAVVPNASSNSTLTAASLTRADRGSLVLVGTNLGGAGANSSNVISSASLTGDLIGGGGAAGSTNISILPYAYAVNTVTTASGQLTTYDSALGFRPLTNAEYVGTLTGIRGSSSTNNVKVGGAVAMNKGTTVNSLVIDSASSALIGGGVYGSTFITPTSGVVMFSISGGATASTIAPIVSTNFDFLGQEAVIHAQNNGAMTGTISGFGGLTKSGNGTLLLSGANNITGAITINGGSLAIASNAALGDPTNSITLAGGPISGINFAPCDLLGTGTVQSLTLNRNINLVGAGGGLQTTLSNTTMTVSGVISGSGNLFSGVGTVGNIGTLKLTGANTYTGTTFVQGNLAVNSDANLGTGTDLVMAGGYLRNDGAFTSNKNILIQPGLTLTSTSFITNGFDMTLNGTISNQIAATIIKGGTNSLILTANNPFNGSLQVGQVAPVGDQDHLFMGGSVVLSGANGSLASMATANVLGGASLILDNTAANNGNRLSANVTVGGGTLEFRGNGSAASTETIGALGAGNFSPAAGNGAGIVNIAPGSGQSAVLTASGFTRTGAAAMLVRGANLGGAIGADTANLVFNTAPTLTNGIIAGMVGDTSLAGNGSGFVTHVAGTGVRLLNAGEYSAMPLSGVTTVNADVISANVLSGATSVNSMRIGAGGGVDATGQTLTVTSGMIMANGGANSGIVGGTLAFAAAPATIWANDDLTISSAMTGTGGLNKAGVGSLTLSSASTLTGGAIISNGTLTYGVANALGTANALTLGTTGSAVGTLNLNGFTGTFASFAGFGNINLNGGSLVSAGGGTTILYSGSISGNGSVTINGTMGIAGVSSFTGDLRVANAGTLTVSANQPTVGNGPLGSSGNLILGDATTVGSLSFGTNVGSMNKNIVVAANTNSSFPTINQNAGSNVSLGGSITVNRTLRLSGGFSTLVPYTGCTTLAGDISGAGGLDWFGGNFNLNGNNSYAGGFNFFPGSSDPETMFLGVGTNSALGTGNGTIGTAAGNLRADNGARTLANNFYFTSASASRFGFAGVNDLTITGKLDLGGGDFAGATPPSLAGARTLQVTNTGKTTLAGVVSGAATATLTKTGGGSLYMAAANTFAGNVTVNAGGLYVNGTNSGAGTYTVAANALLGGSGVITGSVTINAGGILEPGNSAGTLSTGSLSLASGAYMIWELGNPLNPTASDLAAVSGNLNIAGGTGSVLLNIETLPSFMLQPGSTTWVIMTYTGTLTGSAANFTLGALPTFVTSATIDTTSSPGQVLLTLVPTPGAAALFGVAGLGAFRRRRTA